MECDLLTVQEAAKELNVSEGAVRTAISAGRIPHVVKLGRKAIHRADLIAYKQRTQPDGGKRIGRPPGSRAIKPREKE